MFWNRMRSSAGNILVVEAAEQPTRIMVVEGWRTVAELDATGKLVARHALDLPEQAAITYLRTAIDRSGKRFSWRPRRWRQNSIIR